MDHGQILEQPYYTTVPTTTSTDNNLGLSAMDFSLQGFPPQPPQVQAQFQEAYSQIDFFYEQPQQQQQPPPPTNTTFNINTTNTTTTTTTSNDTVMDEDYVQNLTNELQHTKQLLKQYQLRTEQLMELVTKQTDKIKELREQLKNTTATL